MTEPTQIRRWHIYPTPQDLVDHAAVTINRCAEEAIALSGEFHIVLAGGQTPRAIYSRLRFLNTDWAGWHVYLGDERCLPPEHPQRNSQMIMESWLGHVPIPAAQYFPIPAERGPEDGARAYAEIIGSVPNFHLVLLGLGEDGHTASLFPGNPWGCGPESPLVLPVDNAAKAPPERVTLSARALSHARQVFFIVTGENKQLPIERWRRGESIPAAAITPPAGVDIWMDMAACWA